MCLSLLLIFAIFLRILANSPNVLEMVYNLEDKRYTVHLALKPCKSPILSLAKEENPSRICQKQDLSQANSNGFSLHIAPTVVAVTAWPASLVSLAALESAISVSLQLCCTSAVAVAVAGLAKPASLESPLSPTLQKRRAFHVIASPSRCALNNLTHQNNPTPTSPTSALRSALQRSTTTSALPLINLYSFPSSAYSSC
jgi:hypothetical protein